MSKRLKKLNQGQINLHEYNMLKSVLDIKKFIAQNRFLVQFPLRQNIRWSFVHFTKIFVEASLRKGSFTISFCMQRLSKLF